MEFKVCFTKLDSFDSMDESSILRNCARGLSSVLECKQFYGTCEKDYKEIDFIDEKLNYLSRQWIELESCLLVGEIPDINEFNTLWCETNMYYELVSYYKVHDND